MYIWGIIRLKPLWTDCVGVQCVLADALCSFTAAVWVCRSMPTLLGLNSTAGPLTDSLSLSLLLHTHTQKKVCFFPCSSKVTFHLLFSDSLCCWGVNIVARRDSTDMKTKSSSSIKEATSLVQAHQDEHRDETAFMQKSHWAISALKGCLL